MTWVLILLVAFFSPLERRTMVKQLRVETPFATRADCEEEGARALMDDESPALVFNCIPEPSEEA